MDREALEELKKVLATQVGTLPWQLVVEHETVSDHVGPYEVVVGVRNAKGDMVMATSDDGEDYNPQEARLIYKAITALPKLIEEVELAQWQVIDTAPDKTRVLVFNGGFQTVAYRESKNDLWTYGVTRSGGQMVLFNVTHWMPLPPPPALQSGGSNGK